MSRNILVLVDIQNVYYGSKSYARDDRQIDYEKLLTFIKKDMTDYYHNYNKQLGVNAYTGIGWIPPDQALPPEINLDVRGYVVKTPRNQGTKLFAFLRKIGYSLSTRFYPDNYKENDEWKGTVSNLMQMDLIQMGGDYDGVVVVSGNGVFAPAFEAMADNWQFVDRFICAFKDTLHETYVKRDELVEGILYLDDTVLREVKR